MKSNWIEQRVIQIESEDTLSKIVSKLEVHGEVVCKVVCGAYTGEHVEVIMGDVRVRIYLHDKCYMVSWDGSRAECTEINVHKSTGIWSMELIDSTEVQIRRY